MKRILLSLTVANLVLVAPAEAATIITIPVLNPSENRVLDFIATDLTGPATLTAALSMSASFSCIVDLLNTQNCPQQTANGFLVPAGTSPSFPGDFVVLCNLGFQIGGFSCGKSTHIVSTVLTPGLPTISLMLGTSVSGVQSWAGSLVVSIDDPNASLTLNEVPVPAALSLLMAGLGMLGFSARRKRTLCTTSPQRRSKFSQHFWIELLRCRIWRAVPAPKV
jgi:hypothetical protein